MNIAETGAWHGNANELHAFDLNLANALAAIFKGNTVIDLGCGQGRYVNIFNRKGIRAVGCDGNPVTGVLPNCKVHDLTTPLNVPAADYVLSLEVGEHIPPHLMQGFINNVHRLNKKGVIISWAIPGQGGDGHFNELPNEDIKAIFKELGYTNTLEKETNLRNAATLWWFKNTLMVFDRPN